MKISHLTLGLCLFIATCLVCLACEPDLKHVEREYPQRIVCVYGVKYWLSSGYSILTLLVDINGRPLACEQ